MEIEHVTDYDLLRADLKLQMLAKEQAEATLKMRDPNADGQLLMRFGIPALMAIVVVGVGGQELFALIVFLIGAGIVWLHHRARTRQFDAVYRDRLQLLVLDQMNE
ncbi:MAG: hypothetical protein RIM72_00350 [Alphaproteobacteria bacterium]